MTGPPTGAHRDDGDLDENTVGEDSLNRVLRLLIARRANLDIRLDEGKLAVVLPPVDVKIIELEAGKDFAAGNRQGDKVFPRSIVARQLG